MEIHRQLTDDQFEILFEECRMNPESFTHEAHLRLAWIHINKYGAERAIANIEEQLSRFVDHIGAADKYNKTLTIAAVKAVYHFMLQSQEVDFIAFITSFPELKTRFRELIASHYSLDIFNSQKARSVYLEPDLAEFDI